jgi:hypothetical protein
MIQFRQFLELSEIEAEKTRKLGKKRGPVFDHLFRGKDRIFIPLPPDKQLYMLKRILEKIPHSRYPEQPKYKITNEDLLRGTIKMVARTKDQTTGEDKFVAKNQTTIAKALAAESATDHKIADIMYNWDDIKPYWVVISRHPIDVKRMSDFKNLQSCHSFGGSYYHCTDEEVEDGGGIAYLINSSDIDKIKTDADEIFYDKGFTSSSNDPIEMPHRNMDGITPVARTRLRRAEHYDSNKEIALLEPAVYGIDESGHLAQRFLKAIKDFLISRQPALNDDNLNQYRLKGASYSDSSNSRMYKDTYTENPTYIKNFVAELSEMKNDHDIRVKLHKLVGASPALIMRMGGKRLWLSDIYSAPTSYLFVKTWLADYASSDPNKAFNFSGLNANIPENIHQELEKFTINMLNRRGDYKLAKMGNGWTIIEPIERWIVRPHIRYRRESDSYYPATKLAASISQQMLLNKLNFLLRTK